MAVNKILLLIEMVFVKPIILITTFSWIIEPLPTCAERNLVGGVEEVLSKIDRWLGGMERAIQKQPS